MATRSSLYDTILWKQLETAARSASDQFVSQTLLQDLSKCCTMAADRIKLFPYYHPQFTLHDEVHFLNVVELMGKLLDTHLSSLSPVEIALLIAAAYWHDQGMVPDDWNTIRESDEFHDSEDKWRVTHPYLSEVRARLNDHWLSEREKRKLRDDEGDLVDAHRTDFLRFSHGRRSAELVRAKFHARVLFEPHSEHFADLLGRICESHVLDSRLLDDDVSFGTQERLGDYVINTRLVAIILRLADILDFDRERTPDELYRAIRFTSNVSIREWIKHQSVDNWLVTPQRICYQVQCDRPEFERAIHAFMDWIDNELDWATRHLKAMQDTSRTGHALKLPERVDRGSIGAKNNAYRCTDIEFALSRDELVQLLMTDNLYTDRSLFVREILQNSLDALRYRNALSRSHGQTISDLNIALRHYIDEAGHHVVECADNGIGMDEEVVRNYLTKVGKSYYRSPQFERERVDFARHGFDFDPCARFGIGFMSCFMFADRFRIQTRRDYGPAHPPGPSLEIEIDGLGGLLVVRDGAPTQPIGTTISIIGPRDQLPGHFEDSVKLLDTVDGFAIATEFPITARCEVPGFVSELSVPPVMPKPESIEQRAKLEHILTFTEDFNRVDSNLRGSIVTSVLVNQDGVPTLSNAEASWQCKHDRQILKQLIFSDASRPPVSFNTRATVCLDGIVASGTKGRFTQHGRVERGHAALSLGDSFVLDVRGHLKPTLAPNRMPRTDVSGVPGKEASWRRLRRIVRKCQADLWARITSYFHRGMDPNEFWRMACLHDVPTLDIRSSELYENVSVPFKNKSGLNFVRIKEIESVHFHRMQFREPLNSIFRDFELGLDGFGQFGGMNDMQVWGTRSLAECKTAIISMTHVRIQADRSFLTLQPPENDQCRPSDWIIELGENSRYLSVPIRGDGASLLAGCFPYPILNRSHPVTQFARTFDHFELEQRDRICHFIHDLLTLANSFNDDKNKRLRRRAGVLSQHLDWSRYDISLHPPYSVWDCENGISDITHETLNEWSRISL